MSKLFLFAFIGFFILVNAQQNVTPFPEGLGRLILPDTNFYPIAPPGQPSSQSLQGTSPHFSTLEMTNG
jgi:hypothetical protein